MGAGMSLIGCMAAVVAGVGALYADCGSLEPYRPETWFHVIGENASKEGLTADLEAIRDVGFSGVHFFHGSGGTWPGVTNGIPCLSPGWDDFVHHLGVECERLGLGLRLQNCPGWSMSGGPWIAPSNAMRQLVFSRTVLSSGDASVRLSLPPEADVDWRDYRDVAVVAFPTPEGDKSEDVRPLSVLTNANDWTFTYPRPVTMRTLELPPATKLNHAWCYEPRTTVTVEADGRVVRRIPYPQGAWQEPADFSVALGHACAKIWKVRIEAPHPVALEYVRLRAFARLDNWEALAAHVQRGGIPDAPDYSQGDQINPAQIRILTDFLRTDGTLDWTVPGGSWTVLRFGHVNLGVKNGPAPAAGTGWECDKFDPRGFDANFAGYVGRLLDGPLMGVSVKGLLVDSWECKCQGWTERMRDYFLKDNGYDLIPRLPALFGWIVGSPEASRRFLLDWRRTTSSLVERNYYGRLAARAHARGLEVQFETAFGDVTPGDLLAYWKHADIPMCEFWQPHDDTVGFVGSFNFKPVRPCVSAAHVYGKRRVSAEAFTSLELTWNENFGTLKKAADLHFARGVTHLVFHTYTHNPLVPGPRPGSSFGAGIGTPFLRNQTWWRFMPELTTYFARCCRMLERGLPVVDVLWYLGDDIGHKPDENAAFPDGYKYDYCNRDVLMTRLQTKNGRLVLPDGMSYRALWIPEGTFLLPETEKKLGELSAAGARVIRGAFCPDWPSEGDKIGLTPKAWYQRRDGDEDIFFVILPDDETVFVNVRNGNRCVYDPVSGSERAAWRDATANLSVTPLKLSPVREYPVWAIERTYACQGLGREEGVCVLSLGVVRDWAEVFVNGARVAKLWTAPYSYDIGPFLNRDRNDVRVVVTSTWHNRLAYDLTLPQEDRSTWTVYGGKFDRSFLPSGLEGPVRLMRFREGGIR